MPTVFPARFAWYLFSAAPAGWLIYLVLVAPIVFGKLFSFSSVLLAPPASAALLVNWRQVCARTASTDL